MTARQPAHRHLVVGATGAAGDGVTRYLAAANDEPVFALSRGGGVPPGLQGRVTPLAADLLDADALAAALRQAAPTRVYYAAHAHPPSNLEDLDPRAMQRLMRWGRPFTPLWSGLPGVGDAIYRLIGGRAGIVDSGRNGAMIRALTAALRGPAGASVQHLGVLTGARLYGVHLGPALYRGYPAVLREDSPRHPGPSWYFEVEDAAAALAAEGRVGVTVHRPHFVLASVRGVPYSLVNAVGVYAALCRAAGRPLVFLGGEAVYRARFEAVSAEVIGAQMAWAAATPAARGEAFNVSNGGPMWWPEVWEAVAARFGLAVEVPAQACHLSAVIDDAEGRWDALRRQHGMAPMPLREAFPQPFLHQAMVMTWDVHLDVGKAARLGFAERRAHVDEFLRLIDRLQEQGTLPPLAAG